VQDATVSSRKRAMSSKPPAWGTGGYPTEESGPCPSLTIESKKPLVAEDPRAKARRKASLETPYVWIAQDLENPATGSSLTPVVSSAGGEITGWKPLWKSDALRLEKAWQQLVLKDGLRPGGTDESAGGGDTVMVRVENGRYEVDVKARTRRAIYWDEPITRVLRCLWLHGPKDRRVPYEEEDAEDIEDAFCRVYTNAVPTPFLACVNKGMYDVRFAVSSGYFLPDNAPHVATVTEGARGSYTQVHYEISQEGVELDNDVHEPVWRGVFVKDEDEERCADEEHLPAKVSALVLVVHGIGLNHRAIVSQKGSFANDLVNYRSMAGHRMRQLQQDNGQLESRVEFLPLPWYDSMDFAGQFGETLQSVTLPSLAALRSWTNLALGEVLIYSNKEWRCRVLSDLADKMRQLLGTFTADNPDFGGNVVLVGHSLGSVVSFDLIQALKVKSTAGLLVNTPGYNPQRDLRPSTFLPREKAEGLPMPRVFFSLGSPLGLLWTIWLSNSEQSAAEVYYGLETKDDQESGKRGGWRHFNVYNRHDPVAYRIEPLLNANYVGVEPRPVPQHSAWKIMRALFGGHSHVSDELDASKGSVSHDVLIIPPEDGGSPESGGKDGSATPKKSPQSGEVRVDRIDYVLQESASPLNETLAALQCHFVNMQNADFWHFVVDRTYAACIQQP